MRKNNIWNRLFHNSEIKKNKEQVIVYRQQLDIGQYLIDSIKEAKSLYSLLQIHKTAWGAGFKSYNLGPCPYGMFRTSNILTMTPNEVYLGDIYGLFTENIYFWEINKLGKFGVNGFGIKEEVLIYDIILNQYKNILLHNILPMFEKASKEYPKYIKFGY